MFRDGIFESFGDFLDSVKESTGDLNEGAYVCTECGSKRTSEVGDEWKCMDCGSVGKIPTGDSLDIPTKEGKEVKEQNMVRFASSAYEQGSHLYKEFERDLQEKGIVPLETSIRPMNSESAAYLVGSEHAEDFKRLSDLIGLGFEVAESKLEEKDIASMTDDELAAHWDYLDVPEKQRGPQKDSTRAELDRVRAEMAKRPRWKNESKLEEDTRKEADQTMQPQEEQPKEDAERLSMEDWSEEGKEGEPKRKDDVEYPSELREPEEKEFDQEVKYESKKDPLHLCNSCCKTFRSKEDACTFCESTETERVVKEEAAMDWKCTDCGYQYKQKWSPANKCPKCKGKVEVDKSPPEEEEKSYESKEKVPEADVGHYKSVFSVQYKLNGAEDEDRVEAFDTEDAKRMVLKKQPDADILGAKKVGESKVEEQTEETVIDLLVDHLESEFEEDGVTFEAVENTVQQWSLEITRAVIEGLKGRGVTVFERKVEEQDEVVEEEKTEFPLGGRRFRPKHKDKDPEDEDPGEIGIYKKDKKDNKKAEVTQMFASEGYELSDQQRSVTGEHLEFTKDGFKVKVFVENPDPRESLKKQGWSDEKIARLEESKVDEGDRARIRSALEKDYIRVEKQLETEQDEETRAKLQKKLTSIEGNLKGLPEFKVDEQEENGYMAVAKGIEDRQTADEVARDKGGQVIADEEDANKFAVIVKKER
jgi:DNA-directed RNA polymerase subunit RPC12/RpoP